MAQQQPPLQPGFHPNWKRLGLIGLGIVILIAACGGLLWLTSRPPAPTAAPEQTQAVAAEVETQAALAPENGTPQGLVFDSTPTPLPDATEVTEPATAEPAYPLAGAEYPGNVTTQGLSAAQLEAAVKFYTAKWEDNGRLWQPDLPEPKDRKYSFAVSGEIVDGTYLFNGVACKMYVDEGREGTGSSGRKIGDHENGVEFTVNSKVNDMPTWFLIECDAAPNTGVELLLVELAP